MRIKRYRLGVEWLNNIMIMMLWFITAEWFLRVINIYVSPVYMLAVSMIIIASYFFRVYIMKLPLYVLAHGVMYVIMTFIPTPIQYKLIGFIALIIFTISNMIFWTGNGVRSFAMIHPVMVLFFLFVFAYASWKDYRELTGTAYVCGVCFGSLYFLRTYLENGIKFASNMLINRNTPVDEMFKRNGRIVFPLIIGFTTGMFLLQSESLAQILSAIVHFIIECMGKVMRFFVSLFPSGTDTVETIDKQPGVLELEPVKAAPEWLITFLLALEKVAAMLIAAFIIYAVLRALIMFIKKFFSRYGYDVDEVMLEDHTEVKERIRTRKRKIRSLFPGTSEIDRIRRRYRSAVERMRRRGYDLQRWHTPRERLGDVQGVDGIKVPEGFKELTDGYEEIRYVKQTDRRMSDIS